MDGWFQRSENIFAQIKRERERVSVLYLDGFLFSLLFNVCSNRCKLFIFDRIHFCSKIPVVPPPLFVNVLLIQSIHNYNRVGCWLLKQTFMGMHRHT